MTNGFHLPNTAQVFHFFTTDFTWKMKKKLRHHLNHNEIRNDSAYRIW